MNIYGPIQTKFIGEPGEVKKRIILFDPSDIYDSITFDPYKRHQSLPMDKMFIQPDKSKCACGCGATLAGRRTRWATTECQRFAVGVFLVMRGDSDYVRLLMRYYLPFECITCKCEEYGIETINGTISGLHVEHILAVKDGGGCCWLGNYQFMCHRCHKEKTAVERQMRNKQSAMPISSYFNL